MQTLETSVNPQSDEFRGNVEAMNAHIQTFREVEQKVLDLAEAAREKFTKRGKLLPRDRINRLLDRGTPFLELCSLAGYKMHDDKD
ncbi:MAG: acyl-CoA carboxylase subunit beta, partial [Marinobacter sp.]